MQKDLKIMQLEKKLLKTSPKGFKDFAHIFTDDDLKKIQSVRSGVNNDSSFVLKIAKALYKNQLHVLEKKSVTGKSKGIPKEAITPAKKSIIVEMFKERCITESPTAALLDNRLKSTNQLIKRAILNIKNAKQKNPANSSAYHPPADTSDSSTAVASGPLPLNPYPYYPQSAFAPSPLLSDSNVATYYPQRNSTLTSATYNAFNHYQNQQ